MKKRILIEYYIEMGGKLKDVDLSKIEFEDYFIGRYDARSDNRKVKSIKMGKGYSVPRLDVIMENGHKYQPELDSIYVEAELTLKNK